MLPWKTYVLILCCSWITNLTYYDTCENTILKYIRDRSIIRGCLCGAFDFFFGDCLPLALVLHLLPTTISCATTTPILAQQRNSTKLVRLITSTPKTSLLSEVGASTLSSNVKRSILNTQGHAQCLEYPSATQGQTAVMTTNRTKKNHLGAPPQRSLLPPPLREQRQRQRRPQRVPIQKNPQPQPLE